VTDKSPTEAQAGLALLCDIHGTVLEVLRDDLGVTSSTLPGGQLALLVDRGSLWKMLDFLVEVRSQGKALHWELNVSCPGRLMPLHLAGFISQGDLIVVGADTADGALRLYEEFEQGCGGGPYAEEEHRPKIHQGRDGAVLDSMTTLYNELLNMQRELAHKTAELERLNARMSTVLSISRDIVSTVDLRSLLDLILEELRSVVNYTSAAILTISDGIVEWHAYRGPDIPAEPSLVRLSPSQVPWVQEIVSSHQGFIVGDWRNDAHAAEILGSADMSPMRAMFEDARSWLCAPFVARSKVLGILTLLHDEPNRFGPDTLRLMEAFTNQVAVAISNARLFEQVEEMAVASERARLARELHDSVAQSLYTIGLYTDATRLALTSGNLGPVEDNVNHIADLVREAMSDMRLLTFELRPSLLEEQGLVEALRDRLDAVESRSGLETSLKVAGEARLPLSAEAEIYRVAQEALNNVMKHARASQVAIDIRSTDESFLLTVEDNGVGFNPQKLQSLGGLGLRTMRERVQHIGGTLAVESEPGSGTTVRVEVER
jgi:signal transduction histidine kinase